MASPEAGQSLPVAKISPNLARSPAQKGNGMAASSKLMIVEAERRFPCRIKLGVPTGGFGERLSEMHAWLDQNCGADGWAMTPAGLRGVVNDAVAIYFLNAALAVAFVSRWCAGQTSRSATGRSGYARISQRIGLSPHHTRRFEGAVETRRVDKTGFGSAPAAVT